MDDNGKYILCGGQDRNIYLWHLDNKYGMVGNVLNNMTRMSISVDGANRQHAEKFQVIEDGTIITAIIAPRRVREHLYRAAHQRYPSGLQELEDAFFIVGDSLGRVTIYENQPGTSRSPSAGGLMSFLPSMRIPKSRLKKSTSMTLEPKSEGMGLSVPFRDPPPRNASPEKETHFQPRQLVKERARVASEPLPSTVSVDEGSLLE